MAWESRQGKQYYYRSVRVGHTVRRVYAGTGEDGQQAAAEDARRRAARLAREEARREEAELWDEAESQLGEFVRLTENLARAALMTAGYFRHARGHFRKKRNMPKTMNAKPETPTRPVPDPEDVKEKEAELKLAEWVRRAEMGDATVMPMLSAIFDVAPSRWKRYGGLAVRVEAVWLKLMAGDNLMLRETVRRQLEEMKAELAGEAATPLERLLVDRAAATWLQCQLADAGAATAQGCTPSEEATALRRQNAAHKRHLQALKSLAVVRRLLRPRLSPVQLAARMADGGSAGVLRPAPTCAGVGVLN
jgi:hypothetical protein